jgi:hypothetical protein
MVEIVAAHQSRAVSAVRRGVRDALVLVGDRRKAGDTCDLRRTRLCRSRRPDELWPQPARSVSSGGRVHRANPQGRQTY